MQFTRKFKALARVTALFSGIWAAIGGIVATLRWVAHPDGSLLTQVGIDALMYGSLGALAGIMTALVLARAEAGRQVERLTTRRVALWGLIGGAAPAALFGLLALVFGGPIDSLLPLIGVGTISGGIGAAVATSVSLAAKRSIGDSPHAPPTHTLM